MEEMVLDLQITRSTIFLFLQLLQMIWARLNLTGKISCGRFYLIFQKIRISLILCQL